MESFHFGNIGMQFSPEIKRYFAVHQKYANTLNKGYILKLFSPWNFHFPWKIFYVRAFLNAMSTQGINYYRIHVDFLASLLPAPLLHHMCVNIKQI